MKFLERDSFILGLLLMIPLLLSLKGLLGAIAVMAFTGATLSGVALVIVNGYMLWAIPHLFFTRWADKVDAQ
jgi:hypothetical protein